MRDVRDVEAAGGDVRRHEQLRAAAAEAQHHTVAASLGHVAVQRHGIEAARAELGDELVDGHLAA
ncbi:MAG: hypothetical protein QOI71_3346, partial [Gaiellales bacterium]|nr:hypothetical protein [Gaiellales bacterium]